MEHRQRDHVGGLVSIRTAIEITLWLAFAWVYLFYAIYESYHGHHIGVAGAAVATIGTVELAAILLGLAMWGMVTWA